MAKLEVQIEGGKLVMCEVLERTFNPDVGARTAWVRHDGREFMAVNKLGAWRKWSRQERVQPLVDDLARRAREKQ